MVHPYLNRLVEAVNPLPSNPLESFTYDEVGNRVNSNQNGTSIFNQANQLTEDANFSYVYDNNGNLIQKTDKIAGAFTLYEYDAENKLVRVVLPNGDVVKYEYDALGRRIEKKVYGISGESYVNYVYDNEDILLEVVGLGAPAALELQARYTHGPGIDEPLIIEKDTDGDFVPDTSFFYHADGLGSITELTDATGTLAQSYTYSSFGKIESQLDPNFMQPYTFTAREFDAETGLYFYKARYYDPATGRFLTKDPIGFLGGDTNLYKYAFQNPVNLTDPSGLDTQIITTTDTFLGFRVGSHSAIRVDNSGDPLLFDPAGSFNAGRRGSGDFFSGQEADLSNFTNFQQSTGSEVEVFNFPTTAAEERIIADRIENFGGVMGGLCTAAVCSVIQGVGPFRNVESTLFPRNLQNQLLDIEGGSCGGF